MAVVSNQSRYAFTDTILQEIKNIISSVRRNKKEFIWRRLLYYGVFLQLGLVYGLWVLFTQATLLTRLIFYPFGMVCALGASAGTHRLWSHNSFKANLPLRILLMVFQSSCKQHSIYEWAVDHRLHHKYSDTNADPHNASRGYFFTHLGWMCVRKNDEVNSKLKLIDFSDLEADSVVMFQKKYRFFPVWSILWCYIIPPLIPLYFWNEDPWTSFVVMGVLRQTIILHFALSTNSIAHKFGTKPYDKNIRPTDNLVINLAAIGEGWHNFHHVFPWDYRSAELGRYKYNFTTSFIEFMARIGWAYDLKVASAKLGKSRSQRTGDGSRKENDDERQNRDVWGWGDKDMDEGDIEVVKDFNNLKELERHL